MSMISRMKRRIAREVEPTNHRVQYTLHSHKLVINHPVQAMLHKHKLVMHNHMEDIVNNHKEATVNSLRVVMDSNYKEVMGNNRHTNKGVNTTDHHRHMDKDIHHREVTVDHNSTHHHQEVIPKVDLHPHLLHGTRQKGLDVQKVGGDGRVQDDT